MARTNLKNIFNLINTANNEVDLEDQFLGDLNAAIEKEHASHARSPSLSYKPSSMVCVRNMYYGVTGAERDPSSFDANFIGILESGTDRHERIQAAVDIMTKYGMDCEYIDVAQYVKDNNLDYLEIKEKSGYETKLWHKDLNISFLCDGIIKYKGEYLILEVKTETIYKWQNRRGPAPEHYAQGTTYSACLGIDKVLFLYENRDNCNKKAYILNITSDMKYDLLLNKIEISERHRELGFPPKIPEDLPSTACTYCPYKTICRLDGE